MIITVVVCNYQNTYATNHIITVDGNKISHNQPLTFDERGISPGYSARHGVTIVNRMNEWLGVRIDSIERDPTSDLALLDAMDFSFYDGNNNLASGKYNSPDLTRQGLLCVPPNSTDDLIIAMKLDKMVGNAVQGMQFKLFFKFHPSTSTTCEDTPLQPGNSDASTLPLLPNTGESQTFFYLLLIITTLSLIGLTIFAILVWRDRRRDGKKPGETHAQSPPRC